MATASSSSTSSSPLLLSPFTSRRPLHLSRCLPTPTRRHASVLLLSSFLSAPFPALADDIPLFGIRKKLRKIEEEAEEIVREGEEVVEKGVKVAEERIQEAEDGINLGGVLQAGVVVGAEAVGVLVGLSVVNGILGPEAQKS